MKKITTNNYSGQIVTGNPEKGIRWQMKKITVRASKTYDVLIGQGILVDIAGLIRNAGISEPGLSCVLVTDDHVDGLYGCEVEKYLEKAGIKVVRFIFPAGESSKNIEVYGRLLNFMAASGITRSDPVITMGGGVSGDLGGFAAATYMRGIKLVAIPTTLIAMTDSSVGGKTAVDLDAGKNLCGCFYQPDLVVCDTRAIDSLPHEIFKDGCAEIIKYGLIGDSKLLKALDETVFDFERVRVIHRCVEMKRDIVEKDEFDLGERRLLNLGHTIGHALEKLSDFNLTHGNAVAKGIAVMAISCEKAGVCSAVCRNKTLGLLEKFGFDLDIGYDCEEIMDAVLNDKKRSAECITWVVLRDYGKSALMKGTVDEFRSFIRPGISR